MGRLSHLIPKLTAAAVIILVPLLVTNCREVASSVVNAPSYLGSYEHGADIRYGELPRQSLDVFVPRGAANVPIVVFWHGGTWMRGSKEEVRFVGAALADAGYVAVLPNYRLIPHVRFPDFLDDGALAVKWVRAHARELGGDPNAIFVMGHSAGGYIAAMLALDTHYLERIGGDPHWIRGWIGLSAPYEMRGDVQFARTVLGVQGAARWRPIDVVSGSAPPGLLVHGLEDRFVHPQEAVNLQAKMGDAGAIADCRIIEDIEHAGTVLNMSLTVAATSVTLAHVQSFVDGVADGSLAAGAPCPSLDGRKAPRGGRPQVPCRAPLRDQIARAN